MPNWCNNSLTVTGDKDEVAKFVEENKGGRVGDGTDHLANGEVEEYELTFEAVLPIPRMPDGQLLGEPQNPEPGVRWTGNDNWHDWCVRNWGTKWDAGTGTEVDYLPNGVLYTFDTAWAPPSAWVQAASEKYPDLTFDIIFEEPGMGFGGREVYAAGDLTDLEEWDSIWNEDTEEFVRA